MSFLFEYFTTTEASPLRANIATVTDVVNDFTIFEDTGDEFFIRTGDLNLNLLSPLPFSVIAGTHNWLAVYVDSISDANLYSVYHIGELSWYNRSFLRKDEKRNIFQTRLSSIGAKFYRDIDERIVTFSSTATDWEFDLVANAVEQLDQIKQENPIIFHQDRMGFSPGDMITNLEGKIADVAYKISDVNTTIPLAQASTVPFLFFGESFPIGSSEQSAIEGTFGFREVTWKNIFEIVAFTENSYIVPRAEIIAGELNLDVLVSQKVNDPGGTPVSVTWIERSFTPNAFRLDGVNITAQDTNYKLGNVESGNVFTAQLTFGSPEIDKDGNILGIALNDSYLCEGTLISGPTPLIYRVLDPGGNDMLAYVVSSNIDANFNNQITAGDFYEGSIQFTGEKLLDRIVIDSNNVHLTLIEAPRNGPARVEAVVLK